MNKGLRNLFFLLTTCGVLLVGRGLLYESSQASANLTTLHYVASDGNCGTNSPCYAQVQAAVDAAGAGDEVRVAAGRYTGVGSRNGTLQLVYIDKSITIRGGYHPQSWTPDPQTNPTILDAQDVGRVLFITGIISPVIDGFHLTQGAAGYGGGIYVEHAAAYLSHNEIHDNWAEGWGGGIYLENSASTVVGNHIYSNTTGASGRGGGVALTDSPAILEDNKVENNRAHVGGGIMMNNTLGEKGALVTGNTIHHNVAYDLQQDGHVFDGAGGGLDLRSYLTDTLKNNVITANIGKWGGGVHAFGANSIFLDNRIQENSAPIHGGGLYVQGGQITLERNTILSNTAENWGGGLLLMGDTALVRNNTFRGNRAGWRGGGMYADSKATFDGNLFLANTAVEQGGGAFLLRSSGAHYQNSVFVDNQAAEGGGIYLWAANVNLFHSTIANNASGDGRAVVIDKYPGLVNPDAPTLYTATVVISNTIMVSQTVGFFATAGNSLTVDGILWQATPTHFQTDGAALALRNERTGDPAFQPDGYHLRAYSAARDRAASALEHDMDGQLRDWGDQKDLGADEYVPTVVITPRFGGTLIYGSPRQGITFTLSVPPGAITQALGLMFQPFPPLPPAVMKSPFGQFVAIGPPFRLTPFQLVPSAPVTVPVDPPMGDPVRPLVFDAPAQLTAKYDLATLKRISELMERMDKMKLQLKSPVRTLGSPPGAPVATVDPACGPVTHDLARETMTVPLCDTGVISTTLQAAAVQLVHLPALEPKSESGLFVFVVEIPETRIYLPLAVR